MKDQGGGGGKNGSVPAAVALPVKILTCASSSEMRRCASAAVSECAWDRSAPHCEQVWLRVGGNGLAVEGCCRSVTVVVVEDICSQCLSWTILAFPHQFRVIGYCARSS